MLTSLFCSAGCGLVDPLLINLQQRGGDDRESELIERLTFFDLEGCLERFC